MIWFTADTHFDHDSIRKYCHRPFESVDEMNETIISNWNTLVGKNESVYHLGDFSFSKTTERVEELISRLNGKIHIIFGNHDKRVVRRAQGFESKSDLKQVKYEGVKIICCHYAMRVWNASNHGTWHLYGHSHGNLDELQDRRSTDVGVDCWGFTPVSFKRIKGVMDSRDFKPILEKNG